MIGERNHLYDHFGYARCDPFGRHRGDAHASQAPRETRRVLMIAFGCAVTDAGLYRLRAGRGIELAAEPDSRVLLHSAPRSIVRTHNLLLDEAMALPGLEAFVLLDQYAEILNCDLCQKLRRALSDPQVAVVGCAGGIGVRSIAWWEGTGAWASSVYRSEELGGDFPGLLPDGWDHYEHADQFHAGEVDTVDGVMMALSPWTVRNIRFDESLGPRYGYDFDFCLQVRAGGQKVVLEALELAHYYPLGVLTDPEIWMEAHMRAAEKWNGNMPNDLGSDWKLRARRAEAQAATARLLAASKMYEAQAREWQHQRELATAADSVSWRLTAPLRRANAMRKQVRSRISR